MDIANQKISIAIVVKLFVFICSLLGVWYHNKYEVESLNEKVKKIQEHQESYNIQVIEQNIQYNRLHIDRLEKQLQNKKDKN
jgi:hypothetical protein